MRRLVGRGRRIVRWILGGAGPLKRRTDRIESGFRIFLLVAVLAAAPVGVVVGGAVKRHDAAVAAGQARDRRPVQAAVLADPVVPDGAGPGSVVPAVVGWTPPDGRQRTATMAVPLGTGAEDRVTVWIGPGERPTSPPLSPRDIFGRALWSGILGGMGLPLVAALLLAGVCTALDARRARQWQVEWLAVEPVWTSRRT